MDNEKRKKRFEGVCAEARADILLAEDSGQAILDASEIVKKVMLHTNLSDMSSEELAELVVTSYVESVFNQLGWRSIIHGKRIFVKAESCKNPVIAEQLFRNAQLQEARADRIVENLKKLWTFKGCDGQLKMIWDDDGNMTPLVELNIDELTEVLQMSLANNEVSMEALNRNIERARQDKQERIDKRA